MQKISHFFIKIRDAYRRYPFFRSLKLRIFLLTFLVGIIPSLILSRSILSNYEDRVINVRTSEVQTQLRVVSNHLLRYNYLKDSSSEVVNAEITQLASLYDGRVLVIDSDLKVVKDTFGMATGKTAVSEDIVRCLERGSSASVSRYVRDDGYMEVIMPISETASLEEQDYSGQNARETVSGVILASVSADSILATLDILERRATLMETILFVVVFSVAMLAATVMVRPFERLTKAISDVKAGFSSNDVRVNDYLETQRIQDAFNQVLGRMRALDESRQEFVSNVSHELKTPMTSMKVLADSLLQDPDTPAEVYRDFLTDIDNEIDRENKIIAELLSLSKMDRKQVQMNVAPVKINNLIETIMKRVRPIAQQRDIEMTLISEREVTAEIDEVKMSMVFTNLIENAVKYNKEHGSVKVTVDSDHKNMIVKVEDTGIGIPKDSQSRVFERFYRVDQSRSREVGGTGLGLSITKSAILLHKGTITLESQEGVGSVFTVTVPLIFNGSSASTGVPGRLGSTGRIPSGRNFAENAQVTPGAGWQREKTSLSDTGSAGRRNGLSSESHMVGLRMQSAVHKLHQQTGGGSSQEDAENPLDQTAVLADMTAPMKKEEQEKERKAREEQEKARLEKAGQIEASQEKTGQKQGKVKKKNLLFFLILPLCLMLAGVLTGCGSTQSSQSRLLASDAAQALKIYYLNQDTTGLTTVPYEPSEEIRQDPQKEIADMLQQLSTQTEDITHIAPIRGFQVNSWELSEGSVALDVSSEYRQQDKITEILARAAIVDTLCQLDDVRSVTFTCDKAALTDAEGKELGPQRADMFINNTGTEIQNYAKVRLHLYFANSAGDQLVDTYRNVVYNSNISMERLIVEQELKGPNSDVVFPTLNPEAKVLSITTRDYVCYVNLDQAFLTDPYNVTGQAAIYSIVNALTNLPSVSQVQFSIDGNTNQQFMDSISLTTLFERNEDIIQSASIQSTS